MSTPEPGSAVVLGRTVRAEWTRLWTVRTSWVFVAVAVLGVAGISLLVGLDARDPGAVQPDETAWIPVQILGMLLLLVLLAFASVSTTADHGELADPSSPAIAIREGAGHPSGWCAGWPSAPDDAARRP